MAGSLHKECLRKEPSAALVLAIMHECLCLRQANTLNLRCSESSIHTGSLLRAQFRRLVSTSQAHNLERMAPNPLFPL